MLWGDSISTVRSEIDNKATPYNVGSVLLRLFSALGG